MKKQYIIYLLPLMLLISSCAAMAKYDNVRFCNGEIYPFEATIADTGMIYNNIVQGKPDGEKPDPFDFFYSPYMIPYYILDTPVSLVADTITLPFDLIYWGDKWEDENSEPEKLLDLTATQ